MALRPYWKGYLKLSLVTCPVQMMPATSENEKVRFHTLNRETQNRVVSRYVDAVTGKEVEEEDEAKGYQRGENDYISSRMTSLRTLRSRARRPSISMCSRHAIQLNGSGSKPPIICRRMIRSAKRPSR